MRKHLVDSAPLKNAISALTSRWGGCQAAPAPARRAPLARAIKPAIETLEVRAMLSATWSTYSAPKPSGKAPQAVLKLLDPVEMVGAAITVDGTSTGVGNGSPASSNYVWSFGDKNGSYNTLAGFNASHVYTASGTYTVSLTVTNNLGLSSTVSTTVNIAADTRKLIYVDSSSGNDNNSGSSPSSAVKTVYKAESMLGNNSEILFKRGESFAMSGNSLALAATNQLVSAYGSGADPILAFTGTAAYQNILTTSINSMGVTFENLAIKTVSGTQPFGLEARGYDVAILNCTFNNVNYAVNANGEPTGLLVQNCSSPSKTGIYGYFVWGEGNDLSVLGNYVADSENEHNVRTTDFDGLLVAYNNFNNDDGKGCIEVHDGIYSWVAHNTVSGGDIRVGPLGIASDPSNSNTTNSVIDGNTFNSGSWMQVDPGSYHISIRNNVINKDSAAAIYLAGSDSSGRQDSDIEILNNTGVSDGSTGNFLHVGGPCEGIVLEDNLVIAPELSPGGYGTAVVYVAQSNLNSFSAINGNVWQLPTTSYSYAAGGVMFIDPTSSSQTGYYTPAMWNALSVVGTDVFSTTSTSMTATPAATIADGAATLDLNVPTPSSSSAAAKADAPIGGVFTDFYGNTRSTSGAWTAGAVQVGAPMDASPVATINNGGGGSSSGSSSSGGSTSGGSTSGGSSSSGSTGGVSGTVTDAGKGLAGITVYLDANNNSAHDSGELSTTTDSSGNYSFTGVAPGAYIVRQILPSGISQLNPTLNYGNHITVSSGSTVSGQNFTDSGTSSSGSSTGLPSGWSSTDIGTVGATGSTAYSSSAGTYVVNGAGTDIYNLNDGFHYTYTTLTGNGTIVAKVSNLGTSDPYAKAGVMIRNGTASNAAEVSMNLSPSKFAELDYRVGAGSGTGNTALVGVNLPEWVKLVRSGNTFSGFVSSNGTSWQLVGVETVSMASSVEIGLDVSSKEVGTLESATFGNVAITT